jgi:hypothetical protein
VRDQVWNANWEDWMAERVRNGDAREELQIGVLVRGEFMG